MSISKASTAGHTTQSFGPDHRSETQSTTPDRPGPGFGPDRPGPIGPKLLVQNSTHPQNNRQRTPPKPNTQHAARPRTRFPTPKKAVLSAVGAAESAALGEGEGRPARGVPSGCTPQHTPGHAPNLLSAWQVGGVKVQVRGPMSTGCQRTSTVASAAHRALTTPALLLDPHSGTRSKQGRNPFETSETPRVQPKCPNRTRKSPLSVFGNRWLRAFSGRPRGFSSRQRPAGFSSKCMLS
jgi:hypothetical protein